MIYIVIKAGKDFEGNFMMVSTEMAFRSKEMAQQWVAGKPVVWEEMINNVECQCERAIHEVELVGE